MSQQDSTDYHRPEDGDMDYMIGNRLLYALAAAKYSYSQESVLFMNKEKGLKAPLSPWEYDELKPYKDIAERTLTASDGVNINIWEKQAQPGQPHYVFFSGNNGHWGDAWPGNKSDPCYDRRMRLDFLARISESGAGFTAVNLRGYGKSEGKPSEEGFKKDIAAIVEHVKEQSIPPESLVVSGASLGTWSTMEAAHQFTQQHMPPSLVELLNPYTSMARLGSEIVRRRSHGKVAFSPKFIDEHVLRHHFNTISLLKTLSPRKTRISIVTSGEDRLIDPSHGQELAKAASDRGITVHYLNVPGAAHHSIPFATLVSDMEQCYAHREDYDRDFWRLRHESHRKLNQHLKHLVVSPQY